MADIMTDVRQISHIAYGFFLSKALFSALNIELFGHLAEGPAGFLQTSREANL